jgi:hypothetical protein
MKPIKSLLAGLLAVAFVASASAQTTIYIVGSNGDRATTNTAIPKLLTGTVTFSGNSGGAVGDPLKSNYGQFTGGSFNGTPVRIKVSYIGATGGIKALAGSQTVPFVLDSATGGAVPDPTVAANPKDNHVPDFSLSTNFQATSPFQGVYQGNTYQTLNDELVAIIGLKILGSKGYPGDNITPAQAQYLFLNGAAPLAIFTGNAADQNRIVYATGRNTDAGQRYGFQADTGIGINAVVKQYKPTITGAAAGVGGFVTGGTVTSHVLWPRETVSGVDSRFNGNSGATTGANLAPYLTATLSAAAAGAYGTGATEAWYISYLTPGDADTIAIPNGAVELKFNGVAYSADNVRQGKYTAWLYEHVLTPPGISGIQASFATALTNQIRDVDAGVAGIFLNTVKVGRTGEGELITPDYF